MSFSLENQCAGINTFLPTQQFHERGLRGGKLLMKRLHLRISNSRISCCDHKAFEKIRAPTMRPVSSQCKISRKTSYKLYKNENSENGEDR